MRTSIGFLAIALSACGPAEEPRLIGFPGMEVEEFNRLNADVGISVDPNIYDWSGMNAPHILELRHNGEVLEIPVRANSGGTHITSQGGTYSLHPPRIEAFAFDVGPSYRPLVDAVPYWHSLCRTFARWGGDPEPELPDAGQVSSMLQSGNDILRDAVICSGGGGTLSYSIIAQHYVGHHDHGGDFSMSGADGYIGLPIRALKTE